MTENQSQTAEAKTGTKAGAKVRKRYTRVSYLRWGIMGAFLLFMLFVSYQHNAIGGGLTGYPTVDALCPFGGVESLYKIIIAGELLQRVAFSSVVLAVSVIFLALVSRRSFCGWICPLGAIQEWLGVLGRKIMGRLLQIPASIDRYLRWLKYILLVVILYFTWRLADLVFRPYDPWATLMHLWEGPGVLEKFSYGLAVLGLLAAGSFFLDRFWCKYACPLGALLAICSWPGQILLRRDPEICIKCGMCNRVCPMNIKVLEQEKITDWECINCLDCQNNCPKPGALSLDRLSARAGAKPVSLTTLVVVVLGIFFGMYGLARAADLWQSTNSGATITNILHQETGEPSDPNQLPIVEEIKGYMTIEQVAAMYRLTTPELYQLLNLPADIPATTKLKELSSYPQAGGLDEELIRTIIKEKVVDK